jgi:membrane-associated protein
MHELINYIKYLGYWGYLAMFLVIFFESFPMTFFFPGDSLLFTAGILASTGYFDVSLLVVIFFVAGFFGYVFSYFFGQKIIKKFFTNPNSKIFNPKYIVYTHNFFEKYGGKTIIIGRFVPVVRSFGPALAGVADLTFKRFLVYDFIGGLFWAGGVTALGFYLGSIFPQNENFLTPIIILIIFVSILPTIFEYTRTHLKNKH